MQVQDHQELAVCKDRTQISKGKRTKRQRLPSPLSLAAMPSSTYSGGADLATTSPALEFRDRTTEEEDEDMANCLILLAQGHHQTQKSEKASSHAQHVQAEPEPEPDDDHHNNNNRSSSTSRLYLYQCKTCDRCFPSFQALGGHRASHKKPKPTNVAVSGTVEEKQQAVTTTFVDHQYDSTTSTMLSLQMPNRALYSINTTTSTSIKSKVHECSMCGAEFSSGQALGGHMRRHRTFVSTSSTTISMSGGSPEETKKPRNVLKLDLNLPAPDDNDHRESKFPFKPNEKVIVFSASPLVDCHY